MPPGTKHLGPVPGRGMGIYCLETMQSVKPDLRQVAGCCHSITGFVKQDLLFLDSHQQVVLDQD